MLFIILMFWTLTALFGNDFLKFNIFHGLNPLFAFMGLSIVYLLVWFIKQYTEYRKTENAIKEDTHNYIRYWYIFLKWGILFLLYAGFIIIISFLNLPDLFQISNVGYAEAFIFRQSYFIFCIPIGVMIFRELIIREFDYKKILIGAYILWSFLFCWSLFLPYDSIPFRMLVFAVVIYIFSLKSTIFSIVIFILSYKMLDFSQMSFVLALIIAMIIIIFPQLIVFISKKHFTLILFGTITIIVLLGIIWNEKILEILSRDPNTSWRFQYWINECRILWKTKLFGVGFGTAYADSNLFIEINNAEALTRMAEDSYNINIIYSLFVTAQHNSLLNVFYRMGIIGGILFLKPIIIMIEWFSNIWKEIDSTGKKILKWSFSNVTINIVMICLNPGMESPRFFIGFLISIPIMLAALYKNTLNIAKVYYE